jgi:hypothetical protein
MCVQRNIEARSCSHCCSGKAVRITYSESVFVALDIQHAMRMRHVTLSSLRWPALQFCPTLSHKRHDFREKKVTEHKMCFDFLYNFCLKIFSHSKN